MNDLNLDHPLNQGVLAYLANPERRRRAVSVASGIRVCAASEVADPYLTLGTHPDQCWTWPNGARSLT